MKTRYEKRLMALTLSAVIAAVPAVQTVRAEEQTDGFAEKLIAEMQEPEMQYRPYARWWLAEGSHTDETLRESIRELYDAGYGGVEFLTLDESQFLDDASYAWGSPEWIHDSQLVISECQKLGMSVSMTSGTHWATANLTVIDPDQEEASQELGWTVTEPLKGNFEGELSLCELPEDTKKQKLAGVVAAKILETSEEGPTILDFATLAEVTEKISEKTDADGYTESVSVDYQAPDADGDYVLFAFYQYGTGEFFTPASTGKSYTINYLSREGADALINYWNENVLTDEVQGIIDEIDECDMYMDSLELNPKGPQTTGQLWTADMEAEFSSRAGYDLVAYLPLLIKNAPDGGSFGTPLTYSYEVDESGAAFAKNLRNDFYQVTTELYTEECLQPLADWLHSRNMKLRAENSYGKTFEISEPIKALDYVETEAFEFGNEIDSYRAMAGGAHVFGKRYSSETGALMFANYLYNNGYFRQIFYMQYAAGVQKTVTHGYSSEYGPDGRVFWPGYEGMMDMFSERMNKRQPGFIDYPELNRHLSRIQKTLEQGVPQMDLAILRTDFALNNWTYEYAGGNDMYYNMVHNNTGIYWQDMTLQNAGFTYDYFSPFLLTDEALSCKDGKLNADGAAYQAVILYQDELPYESAEVLLDWAKSGLPVIFVNHASELEDFGDPKTYETAAVTTGSNDGKDQELAAVVEEIKAQPCVRTVDSEEEAYGALQELGIRPRAEYGQQNAKLLTALRADDDADYLYVYHYMYQDEDDYQGQISLDGEFTPFLLNTWSGEVQVYDSYEIQDGRTVLDVTMIPGQTAVFALKKAAEESAGEKQNDTEAAPEIIEFNGWNLQVDSFEPGEKVERTETNEETGLTTTEYTYTTLHTAVDVGTLDDLVSWNEIPAVGESVSGIGTYTAAFTLPEDYNVETMKAVFRADSFCYGTAALWVNGQKVPVDMDGACADISAVVQPGENKIEVRVTSSLRNIMREVGYMMGDDGADDSGSSSLRGGAGGWIVQPEPDAYGMTGKTIVTISER